MLLKQLCDLLIHVVVSIELGGLPVLVVLWEELARRNYMFAGELQAVGRRLVLDPSPQLHVYLCSERLSSLLGNWELLL